MVCALALALVQLAVVMLFLLLLHTIFFVGMVSIGVCCCCVPVLLTSMLLSNQSARLVCVFACFVFCFGRAGGQALILCDCLAALMLRLRGLDALPSPRTARGG